MYVSSDGKTLKEHERAQLDEQYSRFLLEELENNGRIRLDLKLFDRGFLLAFRNFPMGDWTRFYLLEQRIPLIGIEPWKNELPPACTLLIACVDALYWEVYARDPTLLSQLRKRFPSASVRDLENSVA
jgi:hypothetical protein